VGEAHSWPFACPRQPHRMYDPLPDDGTTLCSDLLRNRFGRRRTDWRHRRLVQDSSAELRRRFARRARSHTLRSPAGRCCLLPRTQRRHEQEVASVDLLKASSSSPPCALKSRRSQVRDSNIAPRGQRTPAMLFRLKCLNSGRTPRVAVSGGARRSLRRLRRGNRAPGCPGSAGPEPHCF